MLPFLSISQGKHVTGSHYTKLRNLGIIVIILSLFYFSLSAFDSHVRPGTVDYLSSFIPQRYNEPQVRPGIVEMTFYPTTENKRYLSSDLAVHTGLGNHIFELMSVYGMSRTLDRIPAFFIETERYQKMLNYTREIVPGLIDQFTVFPGKLPEGTKNTTLENRKCCVFHDPMKFANNTDTHLHFMNHFYQSWKYFPNRRDEIRSYLKPQKEFRILPESNQTNQITCIHVRRGDFLRMKFYMSEASFIQKAVEYIQNQESNHKQVNQITVMFGDDPQFMKDIFPGAVFSNVTESEVNNTTVHFISSNSPSDDLLYSSQHCDTLLISAPISTFGWWLGYLSKGNQVFYHDVRAVNEGLYKVGHLSPVEFYPPKWTALKFSSDNSTVIKSDL